MWLGIERCCRCYLPGLFCYYSLRGRKQTEYVRRERISCGCQLYRRRHAVESQVIVDVEGEMECFLPWAAFWLHHEG